MIRTTISGLILQGVLGLIASVLLHELTHLIVTKLCRIRIRYVLVTWWSGIGWMQYNDDWVKDNLKVFLIHLTPMIWCLLVLVNPDMFFFWAFLFTNSAGAVLDIFYFIKIMSIPKNKRKEWLDKADEKVMKTVIWKRKIDD